MGTLIHILHLEDNPADRELIQVTLTDAGLDCRLTQVQTRDEFENALHNGTVDIILADYRLPMFDGMSALKMAQELQPEIPFVFVTGTLGEEVAIEALTQGATDYVLKHILSRLVPAVQRALQEARDRRERRQAQEALQRSNAMLQAIIEAAPVAIIGLDLDGCVHSVWNPAAEKMLGWNAQEVMGRPLPAIPVDRQEAFGRFRDRIRKGRPLDGVEVRLKRRDGTPIDYSIYASPLHNTQGAVCGNITVLVDITERKHAVVSIRKLSQVIEQSPVSIVITDAEGSIEFVNAKFTEITGYTPAEVLGQNPSILRSGETPVEVYRHLWETITAGGVWQGEFHNRKKNGGLFWEQATIAPVRDTDNVTTHYVAVKQDITEQKKLEAQLSQSRKMEAIGQLAGGVAHDFNNMLGVIIGHAEMALGESDLDDALHNSFEEILKAGLRSTDITRQLLAFARKQTIVPRILDLNETIEEMLKLLRRLIGEDIELAWLPGAKLWPLKMDPSQIDQILANLCVNARDAIAGVGKITIETHRVIFDDAYCAEHKGFSPGEYVMLAVSDNGSGMDKTTMDKIFEPFYTTKEIGRGTGLGLATVYGIVKQNVGFINVYSEPGHGSTFKLYLPRHTAMAAQQEPMTGTAPQALRGHETILVVEDETLHLRVVKLMLEKYGYQVLAASTPADALRFTKGHTGGIHLLLSDLIMPEMNGRDLADEIIDLYPNVRCLFMSGYTGNVTVQHGVLKEGIHFIQKPFAKLDLITKVRAVLDSEKKM